MTETAPTQATSTSFRKLTQPTVGVGGTYNNTTTMTTAVQPLPTYFVAPVNVLRGIALEVTCTTSGNSATTAFNADAPLNVFSSVAFNTPTGTPIVGPFDSYTLGMVQKYGGYTRNADPKKSASYVATTGSGSTGGSFTIVYRIPVEIVSRTGLGGLSATGTTNQLQVALSLNASTAIYSTAPTTLPAVAVKGSAEGYWPGPSGRAVPKNFGTTQFWNQTTYNGLSGAQTFQVQSPPGMGLPHRTWMLINRATSGAARSSADFPSPVTLKFRNQELLANYDNLLWVDQMSRQYGYDQVLDAAGGLDTGVFLLPFNSDFTYEVGSETGNSYLDTGGSDPIEIDGTWNASSTLYWITNFINVVGAPATATA